MSFCAFWVFSFRGSCSHTCNLLPFFVLWAGTPIFTIVGATLQANPLRASPLEFVSM